MRECIDVEGHRKIYCREDQNYIFRIRTQKDKDGNIKNALYWEMHGDFSAALDGYIEFTCFLNQESNCRGLEWNGMNLFKNLKPHRGAPIWTDYL